MNSQAAPGPMNILKISFVPWFEFDPLTTLVMVCLTTLSDVISFDFFSVSEQSRHATKWRKLSSKAVCIFAIMSSIWKTRPKLPRRGCSGEIFFPELNSTKPWVLQIIFAILEQVNCNRDLVYKEVVGSDSGRCQGYHRIMVCKPKSLYLKK